MSIALYCAVLTLVQLTLLIVYFVKRSDSHWERFSSISIANVLIDILFLGYILIGGSYNSWDGFGLFAISLFLMVINAGLFIIGKIANFFINKLAKSDNTIEILDINTSDQAIIPSSDTATSDSKDTSSKGSTTHTEDTSSEKKTPHKSTQIVSTKVKRFTLAPKVTTAGKKVYLILLITTTLTFLSDIGYNILITQSIDDKKETYSKTVVELLTEKYGDCGFKVDTVEYLDEDDGGLFESLTPQYEFTVSTNLFNKTFTTIIYADKPNELSGDDFLDIYYENEYGESYISGYIEEYAEEKFKTKLTAKFNVNVTLNANSDFFYDNKFGKIPTPEDLAKYVAIDEVNIEILDNITTLDQLNQYLIALTQYILNDINKVSINDMAPGIIFTFKCDYQKLGITGDHDKYCGFIAIEDSSSLKFQVFDKVTLLPIENFITDATNIATDANSNIN